MESNWTSVHITKLYICIIIDVPEYRTRRDLVGKICTFRLHRLRCELRHAVYPIQESIRSDKDMEAPINTHLSAQESSQDSPANLFKRSVARQAFFRKQTATDLDIALSSTTRTATRIPIPFSINGIKACEGVRSRG